MVTYKAKLLARKDSEDNWINENPTLLNGEFGIATHIVNSIAELKGIKIGAGLAWSDTPYLPLGSSYGSDDAIADVMNAIADSPSINMYYDVDDGKYKFEVIPDGHTHITNVTYNQLVSKIMNNQLLPGNSYRIIDYSTKHVINGTNIINNGPPEPIVIRANAVNVLDADAYSSVYPNDIIRYDINNNLCEDGSTPRNGFITYRKDTILNNEVIGYDFRVVKFKKGRATATLWNASEAYLVGAIVKYDIGGVMGYYILTRDNTPAGTVPTAAPTATSVWELLFKESDNFYIAEYFTFSRDDNYANGYGLSASGSDIKYFYTFNALGHDASNGNYNEFKGYNNVIANSTNNDGLTFLATDDGAGINNNISISPGNQSTFTGNKIQFNTLGYLALGIFCPGCQIFGNTINFYNALFKGIFARNTLENGYLDYFSDGVTDSTFTGYANQNIIKGPFQYNALYIMHSVVGSGFSNNRIKFIGNSFIENDCINNVSGFDMMLGSPTIPIKINSVQFNQPIVPLLDSYNNPIIGTGLTTNAGITLTRVVFNSAITNKKIYANQSDVTVHASPDGALWALSIQNSTGSLTTTFIS
jgi:hypothetical protein